MHRFYAPALAEDDLVRLPDDEAQHLARVLRLREGDAVAIFDGRGREAAARVEAVTSRNVSVRVLSPRAAAPEAQVAVTLAQALLKSDKMDRVIRDAVMLGVADLQPFVSRRSDVPMSAIRGGGRQDRWQRAAVASVKQCGRAVVPPVRAAKSFDELLISAASSLRLMCVEPGSDADVTDLRDLEQRQPSEAMIIVGPEGGWDPEEITAAQVAGVTLVSLGARVLRADAAGASVLSVLRYIWRDL